MPTFATQTPEQEAATAKAAGLTPEQQANVKAGVQSPSLLVTSSASRTNYNNNVNTLNSATQSLTPAAGTPGSSTNGGPNAQTNTPSGTNGGITINTGSTGNAPATSGNGMYQYKLANGNTVSIGDPSINRGMLAGATFVSGPTGKETDPLAAAGTGSGGMDMSGGGGTDPLTKSMSDSIANLDSGIAQAKANMDAALATLQNDPAAAAAVAQIQAKYDQQIELMKQKNAIVLGGAKMTASRNGGLQYANDMYSSFLSDEQDRANSRIMDLVNQETSLILKAQMAYKTGDLKALSQATAAYDKANNDKIDAINKLLTATNNQTKALQAQQKLDASTSKASLAADVSKSNNLGVAIAKNIADSGETDQGTIDSYIQEMADQYGITNTDILKNAVTKAQQQNSKDALAAKNTQSVIDKRNQVKTPAGKKAPGGGTDGAYTYSGDDIGTYSNFLNQGGKVPEGTTYNGRGSDSYVDPGTYVYAYNDWIKNGGTPQGFVKKFPITNVNPASYSTLPAGLQPKAKTTGATAPPLPAKN